MPTVPEQTVRRELDEELKRNRPKDVRKLYDLLTKRYGSEDAYTVMLELITECYESPAEGRYRLNHKKYNTAVSERLKQEKKEKAPSRPALNKGQDGLEALLEEAAEGYEPSAMSEFASKFGMMMIAGRDEEAVKLYIENRDLLKQEINQRIKAVGKHALSGELDTGEYRGYFLTNLIDDITTAFSVTIVTKTAYLDAFEDWLRFILAKEIDWSDNLPTCQMLFESAYRVFLLKQNTGDAGEIYRMLKYMYEGSFGAETIALRVLLPMRTRYTDTKKREIADEVYERHSEVRAGDSLIFGLMASVYDQCGEAEKAKVCRERMERLK